MNPPPSVRYLDAWIARTRRVLGKPALPALGALPIALDSEEVGHA
jgi:hypothetical protein